MCPAQTLSVASRAIQCIKIVQPKNIQTEQGLNDRLVIDWPVLRVAKMLKFLHQTWIGVTSTG
jgi:hypothetical protein